MYILWQIDFVLAYEENASSDLNEETPTLLDIDLDDEDDVRHAENCTLFERLPQRRPKFVI